MSDEGGRKRTRTWREIDKARGHSRHGGSREDAFREEKIQRTQAYQDYKRSLEKVFGGGGELPEALKGQLDPTGSKAKREQALKAVKQLEAEDRKAWSEAAKLFALEFELPDDPYFVDSLLDHPNARVSDKALAKMEALVDAGKVTAAKKPKSLEPRLRSIELTSLDDEQKQRARALLDRLR